MGRLLSQFMPLFLAAFTFAGCATLSNQGNQLELGRETLPEEREELIALADYHWTQGRDIHSVAKGAAALEKAEQSRLDFEVSWRLSRHYAAIGECLEKRSLKRKFLMKALEHGENALAMQADKPEGYASVAVARGLLATTMIAPGKEYQETIEEPAEALMENFPTYQDGLGFRILGGLYTKAPPWPAGVGDLEGAIEVLEEGHRRFPKSALTSFFLAEAYLKDGKRKKATALLRRVLNSERIGEWKLVGARYRGLARQHLADISSSEVSRGH